MPDMIRTTVAAALTALLAAAAAAQDAPAPAEPAPAEQAPAPADQAPPADPAAPGTSGPTPEQTLGLSMGADDAQVGQTYVHEEHGSWEVRCIRTETGNDPCQLYQLLQDEQDNNVAEISIFPLPAGGQAVAGATIITPLETLLTAQMGLRVDQGAVKRYPFSFCSSIGCFARIGLTADEVLGFRRGANATLIIRPVAAPDQEIPLSISLSGFTAGYESVAAANAAALAAQPEQPAPPEQPAQPEQPAPPAQ